MLLINSSVKQANNTGRVIEQVAQYLHGHGRAFDTAAMVPVAPFTGEYVTHCAELPAGAAALCSRLEAHVDHLYFVPTYYKMMPGAFKNFLDIVRLPTLYTGKRIGIVATNAKNQDYGARQFLQVLLGLLEFHSAVSVVVPQILILNPAAIDSAALQEYLTYFNAFPQPLANSASPNHTVLDHTVSES